MINILVVEDNIAIAELIQISLNQVGYNCEYVLDGEKGADLVEAKVYDLILLDIMLPNVSGYELLEYIEPSKTPVIFITAKGSTKDKVYGLQLGADDYIVKPFEIPELLARVEAVLRRYHKSQTHFNIDDIEIDIESRIVKKSNQEVSLTPKEFELLAVLLQNKNTALYRERLFSRVWGEEFDFNTRTLDLHIQRLRKKLELHQRIKTIFKIGYKLEV